MGNIHFMKHPCKLLRKYIYPRLEDALNSNQRQVLAYLDRERKDYWGFSKAVKCLSSMDKLETLRAAFYSENNNILLIHSFASALIGQRRSETALKLVNSLSRKYWNPHIYNAAATALNRLGRHQEALDLLDSLSRKDWNSHIYTTAATALKRLRRYEKALDLYFSNPSINEDSMGLLRRWFVPEDLIEETLSLYRYRSSFPFEELANRISNLKKRMLKFMESNRGRFSRP